MEKEGAEKGTLVLDWEKLLPSQEEDQPAVLIVEPATPTGHHLKQAAMASDQRLNTQRDESLLQLSDHELNESILRKRGVLETLRGKLPDKGEKLRNTLKQLEDEMERRKLRRIDKDADGHEKPTQSTSSNTTGHLDGFTEGITSSQSTFASQFCQKIEGSTDCGTTGAFDKELSILSHVDSQKMTYKGELSQSGRRKGRSSREWSSQCPSNNSKTGLSNCKKKGRASTTYSLHQRGQNLSSCLTNRKDAFQVPHCNRSRAKKEQTIVVLDEDESHIQEMTKQADKLAECMKDAKIMYPSRDDPESIEICYADIDCLVPGGYLTSTIMNFYIRYIQQQASPTNRAICDYHFLNTYFYNKLKEAVSYKGNYKESFFPKFRRWWKGVNIFQKAYVLIPIHEDVHWSLVIICIPDKEDESGPIILHLDSLKLHSSPLIFGHIKCFLKEEWRYLKKEVTPSDLPIAERIWEQLPRRIDEKVIQVPQQKNDSDCGLFVLFFMERFIEEAPERLKKKDLAMFGRQWFKPEEASSLRKKIKKILIKEFQKECEVNHNPESSPLSTSSQNSSD